MTIPATRTAYHIDTGATEMWSIDAHKAVGQHPDEWSWQPWSPEETRSYRQNRHDQACKQARAAGLPEPLPPADIDNTLTDAQRSELEADARARVEAADRLKAVQDEDEQRRKRQEQIDADRALLASPPPQMAQARPAADRAQVPIPDDWQSLSAAKRRSVAIRLGAPHTVTAAEADEVIEREAKGRQTAENRPRPQSIPGVTGSVEANEQPPLANDTDPYTG